MPKLENKNPDRIPVDIWFHKSTTLKYGTQLQNLLDGYPMDIVKVIGPMDGQFYPRTFEAGEYTDEWGSTWNVLQEGMVGEVRKPGLEELSHIHGYQIPMKLLESECLKWDSLIDTKIKEARSKGRFIIGGYVEVFQRCNL